MRTTLTLFPILALFVSTTSGQTANRVLQFAHTEGNQNIQEIATAIRTVADIKDARANPVEKTLALNATPEQIALADWLFHQLDQPPIAATGTQSDASDPYVVKGDVIKSEDENTVRIFYLTNTATIQTFQEAATAVRTVADIRRCFTYNAPRAMIVRGTPDQVALAAWLVNQIGQPAGQTYNMPLAADPHGDVVVRVFHVAHADTMQSFQEIATAIRTIGDIRRVFTYTSTRAIISRSTAEQAALTQWLLDQLDVPPVPAARNSVAYQFDNSWDPANNMVRVFYLPQAATIQDFQQLAARVRSGSNIHRAFTYNEREP